MGDERNGGTLPPPPPVDEAALARSFGLAGSDNEPPVRAAQPSVWRDMPTRKTSLDAAAIARVVTAEDVSAAVLAAELSRLDFALGLEEWMSALDADATAGDDTRLEELLSALHTEALAAAH